VKRHEPTGLADSGLGSGTVVEKGAAVVSSTDPRLWTYTTTAAAPTPSVKVVVDVADLAGQVVEETEHL
jgi:hypothetical protein